MSGYTKFHTERHQHRLTDTLLCNSTECVNEIRVNKTYYLSLLLLMLFFPVDVVLNAKTNSAAQNVWIKTYYALTRFDWFRFIIHYQQPAIYNGYININSIMVIKKGFFSYLVRFYFLSDFY